MAESDLMQKHEMAAFRERVRARLAAMNTGPVEVARRHGVSHQSLHGLISRGPYLQYKSLKRLAEMLDVSVSWLLEGDPRDAFGKRDDVSINSI